MSNLNSIYMIANTISTKHKCLDGTNSLLALLHPDLLKKRSDNFQLTQTRFSYVIPNYLRYILAKVNEQDIIKYSTMPSPL